MEVGDYIIKPEIIREDSNSQYFLCYHPNQPQILFTCKIVNKSLLSSHEYVKLNHFMEHYSEDFYDVYHDDQRVFIIHKVENSGLSLAQILDLRGYFEEPEIRVILSKVAFTIRALYSHNSFPRKFDTANVYIQLNEEDFFIANNQSPLNQKRVMRLKFQNLNFASNDKILSVYINDIVYPEERIKQQNHSKHLSISYNEDISNIGVFYFELITGVNPLDYLCDLQHEITPKIRYNSNTQDIYVSAEGLRFMKKCLQFDIANNKSMTKKIINHRFFQSNSELNGQNELSKISFSELLKIFQKYYRKGETQYPQDEESLEDIPLLEVPQKRQRKHLNNHKNRNQQDEMFEFSTTHDEEESQDQQQYLDTSQQAVIDDFNNNQEQKIIRIPYFNKFVVRNHIQQINFYFYISILMNLRCKLLLKPFISYIQTEATLFWDIDIQNNKYDDSIFRSASFWKCLWRRQFINYKQQGMFNRYKTMKEWFNSHYQQ